MTSDPYPPATSVLNTDPVDEKPAPARSARSQSSPASPQHAPVTPEKPRQHPVAYAALALSLISLIWLVGLSSGSDGGGYQKVRVGTQDCVSVPQDSGPAALYCRTTTTAVK